MFAASFPGLASSPHIWWIDSRYERCGVDLETPPNELAHDFAGAAIDAADARIAPDPGDRIFVHISRSAVELQRGVAGFPLHFGVPIFARCSFIRSEVSGNMTRDGPVQMCPADLKLGPDVGEHESRVLKIHHILAKGLARA